MGQRELLLGFAPPLGDWLVQKAVAAKLSLDMLETVGLIARRAEGNGYYDRFRDRVIFPIRDVQGRPVGFGGRILPSSPLAAKAPKYYNSAETPLFFSCRTKRQLGFAPKTACMTSQVRSVLRSSTKRKVGEIFDF